MGPKTRLKRAAILAMLLLIPAATMMTANSNEPTYASATVDGDYSEWDLTNDFFADMVRGGGPADVLSKLYLRYDCSMNTLYVLVLAESGHTIDVDSGAPGEEHWIKLGGSKIVDDGYRPPNGTPPDFEWVGLSGNTAQGWEASAPLDPGTYNNLHFHTDVDDRETSEVSNLSLTVNACTTAIDLGDLPEEYDNTVLGDDGARHVIGSLYLGSIVDAEPDGQESGDTSGDDTYDGSDDEDGVVRTSGVNWTQTAGGSVDVTVSGIGCICAWIDWTQDGDFADSGETILYNVAVTTGTQSYTFSIPVDPSNKTFFARFRLYPPDGSCTTAKSPTGLASNGEVEDYQWSFGPTAVTLTHLSAKASPGFPVGATAAALAFLASGAAVGGVLVLRRRDR